MKNFVHNDNGVLSLVREAFFPIFPVAMIIANNVTLGAPYRPQFRRRRDLPRVGSALRLATCTHPEQPKRYDARDHRAVCGLLLKAEQVRRQVPSPEAVKRATQRDPRDRAEAEVQRLVTAVPAGSYNSPRG
jgi:hypothetical protein